jgi:pilus assembly protein CpaF
MAQAEGTGIPDEAPRVPTVPRAAGADTWSAADDPSEARRRAAAEEAFSFSPQSEQIIRAIEEGLEDPECTQLDGYGPGKVSAQFRGRNQLLRDLAFSSEEQYEVWLRRLVEGSGAVTTWEKIERDRHGVLNLPGGGRLTIFMPPISTVPTFSLRKHVATRWQPTAFVENGTLSQPMMDFLRRCVASHVNILFVGQFGSGKTSLLRALAQSSMDDGAKIAVVEQVPELAISKPLAVPYLYQPSVPGMDLATILDEQMYNGLDHLIVGEVHMEGLTKMLEVMIIKGGSMSTYHAKSTEEVAERMKLALQLENGNVTAETAASFIRQAIDLIVVLDNVDGQRRVLQITELDWRASAGRGSLGGQDLFLFDHESGRFKNTGVGPDPSGRVADKVRRAGLKLPPEWFLDVDAMARMQGIASGRG